ncbi:MAG: DUF4159 domain-containing protein [Acidobacteria bacterium]|nr:DUF4159 domain-containing protein [Acidobacteriota bacterium]
MRGNRRRRSVALLVALVASAGLASAQFGRGFGGLGGGIRLAPSVMPDAKFTICRIMFESARTFPAAGAGWRTDYPYGDMNLMIRFSELTRAPVSFEAGRRPNHWVVRLTDDALFSCPYTVASDVGRMGLGDYEAERLRTYLLKGGFLWVDDFWGSDAWRYWVSEISQVLPPAEYPIEEVPLTDPIFSSLIQVTKMPQIPNLPFWRGSGGSTTSEVGADGASYPMRVIRDEHGRVMVVMTHNNDIADSWEREGEDPAYFYRFSPDGYALGINVLLHAMTH